MSAGPLPSSFWPAILAMLSLLVSSSPPSPGFLRAVGEVILAFQGDQRKGYHLYLSISVNWESSMTPTFPLPHILQFFRKP